MGILGLAQPLALSTPLTNAQLPFPLFVNGNEVSANVEVTSYALTDGGFGSPQLFDFTIRDPGGTIDPWIAKQQRVLWVDSVNGRYLFAGYIKNIHTRPQAIWQDIDVTCGDLSEALDYGRPIVSYEAGARSTSDQGEIQAMLGIYAQDGQLASGGFIQEMAPAMPGSTPVSRTTLRNGIDQILAASGVQGAVSYVDALGYLHTLAIGDVAAPYAITDAVPGLSIVTEQAVTTGQNHLDGPDVSGSTVITGTYGVNVLGGMLWRSADKGLTWTNIGHPAGNVLTDDVPGIKAAGSGVWYIGCSMSGNASAVFKSTDDGLTWTLMFQPAANLSTEGMSIDVHSGTIIIGNLNATVGNATIWRSTNGGATFSVQSSTYAGANTIDQVRWVTGTTWVAGVFKDSSPATVHVFRSTDDGVTWTDVQTITGTNILSIIVIPATGTVLLGTHPSGIIYRSTNSGATFTSAVTLGVTPGQSQVYGLTVTSGGNIQAFVNQNDSTTAEVYQSTDDGVTWTPLMALNPAYHYHNPVSVDTDTLVLAASFSDGTNPQGTGLIQRMNTAGVSAVIDITDQGADDVDALYVYGATPAASGPVYAWQCGITTPPRSPLRWATLDAPETQTAASMLAAAQVEFIRRASSMTITLTVTGWDGWAKGQLLTVTNSVLGWVQRVFTISAVNMRVLTGKGIREYTITAGSDPVLLSQRLRRLHNKSLGMPLRTGALVGAIGTTNNLTGAG